MPENKGKIAYFGGIKEARFKGMVRPGDVLILHGTMDFIVPASYSEKAEKMYEHCELHLIEGANHGFNAENYGVGDYDEVSWKYIAQYLQSHMTNTAQSEAHATD